MIRVVGPNPVIDRMYYIDRFRADSKFYEIPPKVYAGGKGVNVARVLSQLGEPCVLYLFLGGTGGSLIEEEMRVCGVQVRPFYTVGETRTTVNIIDHVRGKETEITEPGVTIGRDQQQKFLTTLEQDLQPGDMVICTGIPMKGMDTDIYRQVSVLCKNHSCRCVLDATGIYLKESLPSDYYFSKPNFPELSELFDIGEEESLNAILRAGNRMRQFGVENLLVSTGESGGIFFGDGAVLQVRIPQVEVVSTIGSGDAAVTGFCYGANRGFSKEDCLRLAMACGVSNACHSKVGQIDLQQVRELFGQIRLRRIE